MLLEHFSGIAGAAASTTTVDLRTAIPVSGAEVDGQVWMIGDFDVEVVGNDADVTLKGKGPHPASVALSVTDGTFSTGGGKVSLKGFNFAEFEFTTAGGAYTINITRQIQ